MEWLSADPWPQCAAVQQRQAFAGIQFLHLEAAEAVSSFWEDPAPPKKDFPRTREGFEQLPLTRLSFVADGLTVHLPHLNSEADVALAEGIEHLGFALSYSEEKGTGFFRVFQERKVKEGSFPHLLDQLNQLAKGQHRARLRWALLERPVAIIFLIRPRNVQRTFIKADLLPLRATEGNYIAALKRMALRLTAQSATAGPVAKLPLMEEAARYVFHGYDMAETGLEQHIAADAGRKAAVRLGGLARVTVEAQTAAAMRQREDRGAVRAAMAKEQDVLDFLVDLLSLGQPAVTQAVAAVIVCGPLLSQLHVLAAPVWLVPTPEDVDAMQAAEEERARAAQEAQLSRLPGQIPAEDAEGGSAVPAALAESKEAANADETRAAVKALAELCTACGVEAGPDSPEVMLPLSCVAVQEAALATSEVSAQQRVSERQIWLRDCTGTDLLGKEKGIINPFRGAVQVPAFFVVLV
ncbi:hypothetical protein AK812_SmicGene34667 [Symbiodinium microadriaticum]|uniref:Uncharacterized protein n=1 Tax=Symbiodinium microadriaticum TaxID=2951 RepID=A0A1Q9CNG4_SYMMI|nr:hypothetical protein AK812_SmicGene34667 [Symbiodinium microadriaticum]